MQISGDDLGGLQAEEFLVALVHENLRTFVQAESVDPVCLGEVFFVCRCL